MADQADVLVKNQFPAQSVNVRRQLVSDGTTDYETVLSGDTQEQIVLPGPETAMLIQAPNGLDLKDCQIKLDCALDVEVTVSRTNSNWRMRIIPNDIPPEVPTTINVSIGDVEPE